MWVVSGYGIFGTATPPGVWWSPPQSSFPANTFTQIWPRVTGNDAYALDARPSVAVYPVLGRAYYVGGHTQNMMFTEAQQFVPQVLLPPTRAFSVAAVAGPGVTGNAVCYISYWDATHQRRSSLSSGFAVTLTNQQRQWTLPTIGFPSEFITHVELWVSMDGGDPRLVTRVERGVGVFTEVVATLSLGEAFGDLFLEFPVCRYNAVWNYRQVMAGDALHPDRIYFSLLAEPEKWGGFYLRTLDGAAVTGLLVLRENLIVFTPDSSFRVTGFSEDDLDINYFEPGIGAIDHHLIARFHDYAVVASKQQPYLCTASSMHPVGKDFAHTWREVYRNNQTAWETLGWAANDPEEEVLIINTQSLVEIDDEDTGLERFSDAQPGRWVLDYDTIIPETGGGFSQPDLTVDVVARQDNCAGTLSSPDGRRSWLFFGGDDGIVRRANVYSNFNDDADAYGKKLLLRTGHHYFGEEGGDGWDGKKFTTLWLFVTSEAAGYTLALYVGTDYAFQATPADYTEPVPAGAALDVLTNPKVPKSLHYTEPMKSGEGMTLVISQPNGRLKFAGFGGTWEPGQGNRSSITP